jgi:hypothetical protein
MKIIMVLATGALITFTPDSRTNPDCFSKGDEIMQKISTYQDSGPEQGWYLNGTKIQAARTY